jgi:hypothetical protein
MTIKLNGIEFTVNQFFNKIDDEKIKNIILEEKNKIEEKIKNIRKKIGKVNILSGEIDMIYSKRIICFIYLKSKEKLFPLVYYINYPRENKNI